ncbi:CyP450 monooxygenase [Ganoderma leucocontextum]|nr:CyP450 monooxygenase [Ganoderma leucocontextum]
MATDYPFVSVFQIATPLFQLFIVASPLVITFSIAQYIRQTYGKRLPLPPGPHPLPVIGNLFDISKTFSAREYRELSNKYGDVVHLSALGQRIIVLGSLEAANELLDKRSAKYSGKPYSVMSELIQLEWSVALQSSSGEMWRKQRRGLHKFFGVTSAAQWNDMQESSAASLPTLLLEDPQRFSEDAQFTFGSIAMRVAYGIPLKDQHDEALALAMEGVKIFTEAFVPGKYLVESFPILKYIPPWFPGAGFRREAARWRRTYELVRNKSFDKSVARMRKGSFEHSMVTAMVKEAEEEGTFSPQDDAVARCVSVSVHLGGADTTLATIRVFFLAMALNAEAQKRAHAELDAVIGVDRLPSLRDREFLPYVEALVMECHRWHPILPLALPRTYTGEDDDEYNGYRIPKGSIVLANTWAFAHDPHNYPDPEKFMPERYLTGEGKLNPDVRDPRTFTFGYGRRVCPGKHFGDAAVWITVASVLHAFNIDPPLNEKGETIDLIPKFTEGILSAPEAFQCRITPQSSTAEALVRQTPARSRVEAKNAG